MNINRNPLPPGHVRLTIGGEYPFVSIDRIVRIEIDLVYLTDDTVYGTGVLLISWEERLGPPLLHPHPHRASSAAV